MYRILKPIESVSKAWSIGQNLTGIIHYICKNVMLLTSAQKSYVNFIDI